jgi:hypothetical protein
VQAAAALPAIVGHYELSTEQLGRFGRDGHVKLAGVLTAAEIAAYRPHLKRAVEGDASATPKSGRACNIWMLDDAARQFALSERLARIAAELLGASAVRLFRDEPYFKGRGDLNTPWHQDGFFIPLDTDRVVTLWIPLSDLTPDMAPMNYASGSHKAGFLGMCPPDDASMDRFEAGIKSRGFEIHNYGNFPAGDIAAHAGRTLHSSRKNRSERLREVLILIYFADGARVDDSKMAPGGPSIQTLLPGMRPGGLANGPLTPLVYDRSWKQGDRR